MLNKWMLLALVFALVMSLSLVFACGDDDDDDDDDDDTEGDDDVADDDDTGDDDDSYDPSDIYDDCVAWYTDCAGDATGSDIFCSYLNDITDPCVGAVYEAWIQCLIDNVDCDDWENAVDELTACADEAYDAALDCV